MRTSFLKEYYKDLEKKEVDNSFTNYLFGKHKLGTIKENFENKESLAKELSMFVENDRSLNDQISSVKKNLFKHYKKASYDSELAERAWKRIVDEAAKNYAAKVGHEPRLWQELFSDDVRKVVVEEFEQNFRKDLFKGKINMEELFNE